MTDITIKTVTERLTDNSKVYDVVLVQDGRFLRLPCVSKNDANQLVIGLEALISQHTNENAVTWPPLG